MKSAATFMILLNAFLFGVIVIYFLLNELFMEVKLFNKDITLYGVQKKDVVFISIAVTLMASVIFFSYY